MPNISKIQTESQSSTKVAKAEPHAKKAAVKSNKPIVIGKGELTRLIASKMASTHAQADIFLNMYMEAVMECLAQGETVTLLGFGSFEVRQRTARTGRNPKSGEVINIAATQVVGFKVGSQLKKMVAGKTKALKKK